MKKEYMAPDCELIRLRLTRDVLGDSKPEPTLTPIYSDPGDVDDPFGS